MQKDYIAYETVTGRKCNIFSDEILVTVTSALGQICGEFTTSESDTPHIQAVDRLAKHNSYKITTYAEIVAAVKAKKSSKKVKLNELMPDTFPEK